METQTEVRKITVLEPNKRGLKLRIVIRKLKEVKMLKKLELKKVGFMSCPIRRRYMVVR